MELIIGDVEDETILSTIFKDSFSESLRDDAEFGHYLAELSSFGVKRLCHEPDRLAEERAQILEQTQDLAFHNYKTFIQTADCCREIFQDFQVIEKHVDEMLRKLPHLSKTCDQFLKDAHSVNVSRRANNSTLQKHSQLLEILEMPQLMDTCVRNGYYDEALELATHVRRLEKKHATAIPVIANIVSEVRASTHLMLTQLIQQLRTNVQLPACLRVIGYLRRMDVFTEPELRIKFLQARDSWFQNVLSSIPVDDPYHHISKTIEASRVHLFDIITQYRAIFTDDDLLIGTSSSDDRPSDSALFHGWVTCKVSQFLNTLQRDLELGVGGRLDSVLGQCMYFGLSFSRVGADFRGLLVPIFQRAALAGFIKAINDANARFEEMMTSYTLIGTATVTTGNLYSASTQMSSLQPPMSLLEFSPLAVYCNSVLSAFNDLRLCLPLSLAPDIASQLDTSLSSIVTSIVNFHRVDEDTFTPQEHEQFERLCRTFANELVPYFNMCLQALFPPAQLAAALGVPTSEFSKLGRCSQLDTVTIIKPLLSVVATLLDGTDNLPTTDTDVDPALNDSENHRLTVSTETVSAVSMSQSSSTDTVHPPSAVTSADVDSTSELTRQTELSGIDVVIGDESVDDNCDNGQ